MKLKAICALLVILAVACVLGCKEQNEPKVSQGDVNEAAGEVSQNTGTTAPNAQKPADGDTAPDANGGDTTDREWSKIY